MTLWMAADMDLFEEVAQVKLSEDESVSICKDDDDDDDDDDFILVLWLPKPVSESLRATLMES